MMIRPWPVLTQPPRASLSAIGDGSSGTLFPKIDPTVSLKLVRYSPPPSDAPEDDRSRWPFFVEHPVSAFFQIGDQWWLFKFNPSKSYEERIL